VIKIVVIRERRGMVPLGISSLFVSMGFGKQ